MRYSLLIVLYFINVTIIAAQSFIKGEAMLKNGETIQGYFSDNLITEKLVAYKTSLSDNIKSLDAAITNYINIEGKKTLVSKSYCVG
jgi:hypothetical protein